MRTTEDAYDELRELLDDSAPDDDETETEDYVERSPMATWKIVLLVIGFLPAIAVGVLVFICAMAFGVTRGRGGF